MGLFSKVKEIKNAVARPDGATIANARLGRGIITDVRITGMTITTGGIEQHMCDFTLEVALDDTPRYNASCKQRIPVWTMAQIQPGNTTVAVRVDPADPSKVAIDWETPAPTVRIKQGDGASAAEVLARGVPCKAVIIQSQDMGMTNAAGLPVFAFALTVLREGTKPYQIQVGNPVRRDAIPLIFPGSQLPAKVLPEEPNGVVIDWDAAMAGT